MADRVIVPLKEEDIVVYDGLMPLIHEVSGAIYSLGGARLADIWTAAGISVGRLPHVLFHASGFAPEPISGALMARLSPYTTLVMWEKALDDLVEHGLLILEDGVPGSRSYVMTESGRGLMDEVRAEFSARLLAAETALGGVSLARLIELMGRVISACLETPNSWRVQHSRRLAMGDDAPLLEQFDQCVDDLRAFHVDARMGVLQPHKLGGAGLNVLHAILHNSVTPLTAETLAAYVPQHGYGVDEYVAALADMAGRGWLVADTDGHYQVAEAGQQIFDADKAVTEAHFFTPWQVLDKDEVQEVRDLLIELHQRLRILASADIWPLLGETSRAIYALAAPKLGEIWQRAGLAERGLPYSLLWGLMMAPEPVSSKAIGRRFPYAAPAHWETFLKALAEKAVLKPTGTNGSQAYLVADAGQAIWAEVRRGFDARLSEIESEVSVGVAGEELARLAELLGKVVNASLETSYSWGVARQHNLAPGSDSPALAHIDQYLDDLGAFRDDAHLATFAPHEVSGHAWEAFTLIWRGEVEPPTAAAIATKQAHRGHDEATYAEALADLVARGWLVEVDAGYAVTETGKQLREQAEAATEENFFVPWQVLDNAELNEMRNLLTQLRDGLNQLAEALEPAAT